VIGGRNMFYDMLKSRRSIRKFQSRDVEKEKIDTILKSALMSPSSRARKPWEFIAVTDRTLLQKLSDCRQNNSRFLVGAPLGIVVIADRGASDIWIEDATIAAAIIQLSAQSLELASCWIHVRDRMHSENESADKYIADLLEIPENYCVECMIAIGYPAEEKTEHEEKDLSDIKIHFNKY
jgi:nitroreductase